MQEPNSGTLTNSIQTLPFDVVFENERTDAYGLYPDTRVASPVAPVVVRRDAPDGPRYQEARGYRFLVNSMEYPRLAQLDDGRLFLSATGALHPGNIEDPIGYVDDPIMLFSDDEGCTWSQPVRTGMHGLPIGLGDSRLMLFGSERNVGGQFLWFSDDAGETWGDPEPIPALADGRETWQHGSVLVEGDTVTTLSYAEPLTKDDSWLEGSVSRGGTWLRRYRVDKRRWDAPIQLPPWPTSEASVTRARNGDLVISLRTSMPGVPVHSDHWRGITTSRSADDGKTWSDPDHHLLFGYVHSTLRTLSDGRILMTYASRIGELDGMNYHGIEAVISDDNGLTWDWQGRYILFRSDGPGTHSPESVELSDGRIFTILMHGQNYSWDCRQEGSRWDEGKWKGYLNFLGNVSAVIWTS